MKKLIAIVILLQNVLFALWMDVNQLPSSTKHISPKALSIVEARESIGYPPELARNPKYVIRAKMPIVIIDAGFVGLKKYLKTHPKKKKNILGWITFYKKGKKSTISHGLSVYKSAMADSPNAKYYLLQIDLKDVTSLKKAILYMAKHRLYLANFSISSQDFLGENGVFYDDELHRLLDKYQITLFQSSGNDRKKAHYFKYSDVNKNSFLELDIVDSKKVSSYEYSTIGVHKNKPIFIKLGWNKKDNKDIRGNIELRLIDKNRNVLASISKVEYEKTLFLEYLPKKNGKIFIQVKDKGIKNSKNKHFYLHVRGAYTGYTSSRFNGFSISARRAQKDSPFIVSVGSYGKAKDGKLVPSPFSSYNKTIDGKILPHIMGPGQLVIDGKKIQGTSFSTPFISAFYAKFAGYNIKNFVESSSSKEKFSSSVLPIEKSRWGIPNVMKLNKSYCLGSDKIENFKNNITEKNIVLEFDFSRKCMEHIEYKIALSLLNRRLNEDMIEKSSTLKDKNGKQEYFYSKTFKNIDKNINKQHIVIKIPIKNIRNRIEGTKSGYHFNILTKNTKSPSSLSSQLNYGFILPIDKEEYIDLQGEDALQKGTEYAFFGATKEALSLINRYFEGIKEIKDKEAKPLFLKALMLIRLNKYYEALEVLITLEKINTSRKMDTPIIYKAAIYYAIRDYEKVIQIAEEFKQNGMYDIDLALLEYFSNKWLKRAQKFNIDDSRLSKLIGKYLNTKGDYVVFNNSLGRLELDKPKEYTRVLLDFISIQNALIEGKGRSAQSSINHLFSMGYIDSVFNIVMKAQIGRVKLKKSQPKSKKISKRPTKKVSNSYPKSSFALAEATCKAYKQMDWDKLLSYVVIDLHNDLKRDIKKIDKKPQSFKEDVSRMSCEIEGSRKKSKGVIKYQFNIFGGVYVKLIDGYWKVVKF